MTELIYQEDRERARQASPEVTLDPMDPFERVLIEMVTLNRLKRADYAGDDKWTANFYDSAYQTNTTAGHACELLLSTKASRLRTLLKPGREPKNEPVRDTLRDRAVYSAIAVGIWDEGGYENVSLTVSER
jgi:hypothetical protein